MVSPKGGVRWSSRFRPQSRPGWWALGLLLIQLGSIIAVYTGIVSGRQGGATFLATDNLGLPIPGMLGSAMTLVGAVLAAFAVLRRGERSVLVSAALLWYSVVIVLLLIGFVTEPLP